MAGIEAVNGNNSYYVKSGANSESVRKKQLARLIENRKKHQHQTPQSTSQQEVENMSTAKKVGLGALIITGIAVGADTLFCRGKHVKNIAKNLKRFGKGGEVHLEPAEITVPKVEMEKISKGIGEKITSPVAKVDLPPYTPPVTRVNPIPEPVAITPTVPKLEPVLEPKINPELLPHVEPKVNFELPEVTEMRLQAEKELATLRENIENMTRGEICQERYKLKVFGNEISKLKEKESLGALTSVDKVRLDFLKEKLAILEGRENQIVQSLKKYVPTTSDTSAVSMHHGINGYNSRIREAAKAKATNMAGLDAEEIKEVQRTEELIANIDKEFENLPPLEKDCIVYRGRAEHPILTRLNGDFQVMENAKVGDRVIPDEAYSYTAFHRDIADCWSLGNKQSGFDGKSLRTIMYEIHLPKGAKVSRNMEHSGEVVMPRAAEYIVKDKKVNSEGCMEFVLEYILPKA